ncbi:molybdopterin synthase catalytic subunit [Methylacidiphilum caldifontis]|uniref:Molybdopterin synthase catalytic subunit n=1 Tax=Methylacidiphilum caldifontis TaxID=2795386 RepID=A0A4Y8P9R5_9BACT|nr:molybdenum cofactor biosynthesis protein MoaE [Methylacidiphilum caldifontis]QSR89496.1 molybdenum cofactor biosynthesis protein MoaE [Methylacidiphilum caldifontis]TFE67210.1 molybdopterin converting factor [Methylacidiphilum caldifontis]
MEIEILITEKPIVVPPLEFPLQGETGAIIEFWGVVRLMEKGKKIAGLDYEAYQPMAKKILYEIAEELSKKYPCKKIEVHHRLGAVAVGEPSLFIRIFGKHRMEAFQFAQEYIDKLKAEVPIWKNPLTYGPSCLSSVQS